MRKRPEYIDKLERKWQAKSFTVLMRQMFDLVRQFPMYVDITAYLGAIETLSPEPLNNLYKQMYIDAGRMAKDRLSLVVKQEFDVDEELFIQTMQDYVTTEIGERIARSNVFSKDLLTRIVKQSFAEGLEEGLSTGDLQRRIKLRMRERYGNFSKARALKIANTEITNATQHASLEAARQIGLPLNKVWNTAPIGLAKKERHNLCAGLDGQKRLMHEDFDVCGTPMQRPGDPKGGADQVIYCRCYLTYEVIGMD